MAITVAPKRVAVARRRSVDGTEVAVRSLIGVSRHLHFCITFDWIQPCELVPRTNSQLVDIKPVRLDLAE